MQTTILSSPRKLSKGLICLIALGLIGSATTIRGEVSSGKIEIVN